MKKKAFRIAIICGLGLCLIYALVGPGEETHKQRIEKQFSIVNGEHINLTKAIKEKMQDPGSYKHIETTYNDMDSFIVVAQSYTGTNELGAIVQGKVKAKIDTLGNIISIEER